METHTLTIKVETNYDESEVFEHEDADYPCGFAIISVVVSDASDADVIWDGEMHPAWSYDSPSVHYFRSQRINADSLEFKWTATEERGECPEWLLPYVEDQVLSEATRGVKAAIKNEDFDDAAAGAIRSYRDEA